MNRRDRASTLVVERALTGVRKGTRILTLSGTLPIEQLAIGEKVITRDSGTAILRKVTCRTERCRPIRVKAGSLGHTRPEQDLVIAPQTVLHIRDWRAMALFGASAAMVPASRLIDGEFLAEQDSQDLTVYQLTFDTQNIFYAEGVELGSAEL